MLIRFHRWDGFLETVSDLLETESVQSMREIKHHQSVSCYDHSVLVAYLSYRTAKKLGLDARAAARAGLLHDLYLYNSGECPATEGSHCFYHPKAALENARRITELSEKEENIILSHMWPLSRTLPRSREAMVVSFADKCCATVEGLHIFHMMHLGYRMPSFVPTV